MPEPGLALILRLSETKTGTVAGVPATSGAAVFFSGRVLIYETEPLSTQPFQKRNGYKFITVICN